MKELNRKLVNRMVDKTGFNGGGGNSYVPQSQAVSWTDIDGKPTTLAGYGITDAYWATTQSTSDKRNLTIGSVTQQVITAHQSLSGYATEYWVGQQGYATQSWVGQQGYLTSSALNGYATQTWVGQQGYITSSGSCAYATSAGNADTVDNYHASGLWRSDGGTWNPQADIKMNANTNGCEWSFDMHRNGYTGCIWHVWDEVNGSILVVDGATARVGIGTTSPSYKLHVAGTIYATGSITERSDIRCKDVETYQWCPTLDMIADAPIIRYTMKDDKTHRMRVGSVAQYWEKVMPETVSKDNEGILSIAQGDICMVNIIALAREVRKLREEIIQLKNGRS